MQGLIKTVKSGTVNKTSSLPSTEPNHLSSALMPYFYSSQITLYQGDAAKILQVMQENSVDCIVTSPPYYGPQMYINRLVAIFHEAKRVLKDTGSLWVNIGDTYWSGRGKAHGHDAKQKHRRFARPQDKVGERPWCTPKQLLLIPHRFAIAMQDDGWIVRNDNVWQKPSPTPDPVRDRCALTHEYVFHFVKRRKYYFDTAAVAVPSRGLRDKKTPPSVWTISTAPSKKTHRAVFPEQLMKLPIQATCPADGTLLDPFCGSATALITALIQEPRRSVVGVDISADALKEAEALVRPYYKSIQNINSDIPEMGL